MSYLRHSISCTPPLKNLDCCAGLTSIEGEVGDSVMVLVVNQELGMEPLMEMAVADLLESLLLFTIVLTVASQQL